MSDTQPKVAVIDDWQGVARGCADWSALESRAQLDFYTQAFADESQAARTLAPYQIIVPMRERLMFTRHLLMQLPALRLLALTGYGTRHLDMAYCAERGILCCGSGGAYSPSATAELAIGLMLAAERYIAQADALMRSGGFQHGIAPGHTLEGHTLGLVGLGRIGARVARYAQAFGMRTLAWSQNLNAEHARQLAVEAVSQEQLLSQSDIVSLHLVLSDRSRHTLGAAQLARMRRGALLVNTSRAQLVDQQALLAELSTGRLRAALDVYAHEPLPSEHPFRRLPNTVLTPHLGFTTEATLSEFYGQSLENILSFLDGKPQRVIPP